MLEEPHENSQSTQTVKAKLLPRGFHVRVFRLRGKRGLVLAASLLPAPPWRLTATHRSDPPASVPASRSEDGVSEGKPVWRWTLGPCTEGEARLPGEDGTAGYSCANRTSLFGRSIWKLPDPQSHCLDLGGEAGGGAPIQDVCRGTSAPVTGWSCQLQSGETRRLTGERCWGTDSQTGPEEQEKTNPGFLCP